MKIIKCANNHFYDSEKFESCPHCMAESVDLSAPRIQPFQNTEMSSIDASVSDAVTQPTIPLDNVISSVGGYFEESEPNGIDDDAPTPPISYIGGDFEPQQFMPAQPAQEQFTPAQPAQQQFMPAQPAQQQFTPAQPAQQQFTAAQPAQGQFTPSQSFSQQQTYTQINRVSLDELKEKAQNKTSTNNDAARKIDCDERAVNPTVGWLIGINGDYRGICFELKSGKNFVGRGLDMDVVLESDMAVSRNRHAIIVYEPRSKVFIAIPGESRELFYLNDDVVLQSETLKAYDVLLIGKTKLIFFPLCGEKFSWEDLNK